MHGISVNMLRNLWSLSYSSNLFLNYVIHKEFKAIITKQLVFLAAHPDSTVKVVRSISRLPQSRVNKKYW